MKYKMGDIVFARKAMNNESNEKVENHLYVIIDNDGNVVPADYFGFVVSSQTSKSKDNSIFKYNEPISMSETNNLKSDSIVKCDQLFDIPANKISIKIGTVTTEEMTRFLDAFEDFSNKN